jgi:hypothetical protein
MWCVRSLQCALCPLTPHCAPLSYIHPDYNLSSLKHCTALPYCTHLFEAEPWDGIGVGLGGESGSCCVSCVGREWLAIRGVSLTENQEVSGPGAEGVGVGLHGADDHFGVISWGLDGIIWGNWKVADRIAFSVGWKVGCCRIVFTSCCSCVLQRMRIVRAVQYGTVSTSCAVQYCSHSAVAMFC